MLSINLIRQGRMGVREKSPPRVLLDADGPDTDFLIIGSKRIRLAERIPIHGIEYYLRRGMKNISLLWVPTSFVLHSTNRRLRASS